MSALEVLTKQTLAFVAADPETITITPAGTKVSDGAGGHTVGAGTPFSQTVRLIPQSDRVPLLSTWEGTREKVDYVLLADPAARATINVGATFPWRGRKWKVTAIHAKPDYECKADVVLNG